jgi:3',5'-cyclic AMP phosphodiesterase CpdA
MHKDLVIKKILEWHKGRIVAIGDIHGCITEFQELISDLKITKNDLVVLLGDLVDRGPSSEMVVQFYLQLQKEYNVLAVMGNHDEKIVRYDNHYQKSLADKTYKIPMRYNETYYTLSQSSIQALKDLPHAVFLDNTKTQEPYSIAFVHAGIGPQGFKQHPNAFVRNRFFIKNLETKQITPVSSKQIDNVWYVPEGSYPWTYYWDGRWTVVYGHIVYSTPDVINNTIGIDGGCCFGGSLRAWVRTNYGPSFFLAIKAKRVYHS